MFILLQKTRNPRIPKRYFSIHSKIFSEKLVLIFIYIIKSLSNIILLPGCPIEYTLSNKTCFGIHLERKTWYEAQTFCRSRNDGYDLVIVHDQITNDYIKRMVEIAHKDNANNLHFWIGLKERQTKAKLIKPSYVWGDGTTLSYGIELKSYPWLYNEPNQVIELEVIVSKIFFRIIKPKVLSHNHSNNHYLLQNTGYSCVYFSYLGGWGDNNCTEIKRFICAGRKINT